MSIPIRYNTTMFPRHVQVDRIRGLKRMFDATGRIQHINWDVLTTVPGGRGEIEEVVVYFFHLGRYVSDEELDREFESRGLKPVDPCILVAVHEEDSTFEDAHPNGTHWKDSDGKWCFIAFRQYHGQRHIHVDCHDGGWGADCWFAGVAK